MVEVEHAVRGEIGLAAGDQRNAFGAVETVERVTVEIEDVVHFGAP